MYIDLCMWWNIYSIWFLLCKCLCCLLSVGLSIVFRDISLSTAITYDLMVRHAMKSFIQKIIKKKQHSNGTPLLRVIFTILLRGLVALHFILNLLCWLKTNTWWNCFSTSVLLGYKQSSGMNKPLIRCCVWYFLARTANFYFLCIMTINLGEKNDFIEVMIE